MCELKFDLRAFCCKQNGYCCDEELQEACKVADEFHVNDLLAKGVSPLAQNGRAIVLATEAGHEKILSLLLRIVGPYPHPSKNEALFRACAGGRVDLVGLLISHGADANAHNSLPLFIAAERGNAELFSHLLLRGAMIPEISCDSEFFNTTVSYLERSHECFCRFHHDGLMNFPFILGVGGSVEILQLVRRECPGFGPVGGAANAMKGAVFAENHSMISALWDVPRVYDAFLSASLKKAIVDGNVFFRDDGSPWKFVETLIYSMGAHVVDAPSHDTMQFAATCGCLPAVEILMDYYQSVSKFGDMVKLVRIVVDCCALDNNELLTWILNKFSLRELGKNGILERVFCINMSDFVFVNVLLPRLDSEKVADDDDIVAVFRVFASRLSVSGDNTMSGLVFEQTLDAFDRAIHPAPWPQDCQLLLFQYENSCCLFKHVEHLKVLLSWLSKHKHKNEPSESLNHEAALSSLFCSPSDNYDEESITQNVLIAHLFYKHGLLSATRIFQIAIENGNAPLANEFYGLAEESITRTISLQTAICNNLLDVTEHRFSKEDWSRINNILCIRTCVATDNDQVLQRLLDVCLLPPNDASYFLHMAIISRRRKIARVLSNAGARWELTSQTKVSFHDIVYALTLVEDGALRGPISICEVISCHKHKGRIENREIDTLMAGLLDERIVAEETHFKGSVLECMRKIICDGRFDKLVECLEKVEIRLQAQEKEDLVGFLLEEAVTNGRVVAFLQLLAFHGTAFSGSIYYNILNAAVRAGNMEFVSHLLSPFVSCDFKRQAVKMMLLPCLETSQLVMFRILLHYLTYEKVPDIQAWRTLETPPNASEYVIPWLYTATRKIWNHDCLKECVAILDFPLKRVFARFLPTTSKSNVFLNFLLRNDTGGLTNDDHQIHNLPTHVCIGFLDSGNRDALYAIGNHLPIFYLIHKFCEAWSTANVAEIWQGDYFDTITLLLDLMGGSRGGSNSDEIDSCVSRLLHCMLEYQSYQGMISDTILIKTMLTWASVDWYAKHVTAATPSLVSREQRKQKQYSELIHRRCIQFALQEEGVVRQVLTSLAASQYCGDEGDDDRPPLPLSILENVTLRQSRLTIVYFQDAAARFCDAIQVNN